MNANNGIGLLLAVTVLLPFGQCDARAADRPTLPRDGTKNAVGYWPQWRGPNRDNRSSDTGLLNRWPDGGPPLCWRVDGTGDGIASLAIANGRIFTTTTYADNEFAVAVDEATGERLWATRIGPAVQENALMRWLSQRTPTIDGNRLFTFTNYGWLVSLDASIGKILWRISYPYEFGTKQGAWGFCDRPLVDGDKLICVPGGTQATIVAIDKRTGKIVWKSLLENHEASGYASTLAVETDGLRQYVAFLARGLASFAADDGRLLWRYDRIGAHFANSYTPLIVQGGLLCPNGYGSGIARLKLTRTNDKIVAQERYFTSVQLNQFEDCCVYLDGRLYAFGRGGVIMCFDAGSGKKLWTANENHARMAAVTYAGGRLYVRGNDGTVALVEADPKQYTETSRFKLPEPRDSVGSTFPVVTGGHLYVRDNDRLYCYDVRQQPRKAASVKPKIVLWTPPKDADEKPCLPGQRAANAIYVPTPHEVVEKMLAVAKVGKDDVLYDLGSGDGRILIEAAKTQQCKAIGLEIDRDLVSLSRQRVEEAKLAALIEIREADVFTADFSDATVVTVYLFPDLLKRLMPKFEKLKPGTRIVSHQFEIPGIPPKKTIVVESTETGAKHTIYLWTTPLRK